MPTAPPFSDDPGEELDLPPELAALGSRLTREATVLAQRYPVGGWRSASPRDGEAAVRLLGGESGAVHRRTDVGRFLGPALGILLALSGAVFAVWAPQEKNDWASESAPARAAPRAERLAPAVDSIGDLRPAPPTLPHERLSSGRGAAPPAASSRSIVQELTGPELEGFLDLLENEETAISRLSI